MSPPNRPARPQARRIGYLDLFPPMAEKPAGDGGAFAVGAAAHAPDDRRVAARHAARGRTRRRHGRVHACADRARHRAGRSARPRTQRSVVPAFAHALSRKRMWSAAMRANSRQIAGDDGFLGRGMADVVISGLGLLSMSKQMQVGHPALGVRRAEARWPSRAVHLRTEVAGVARDPRRARSVRAPRRIRVVERAAGHGIRVYTQPFARHPGRAYEEARLILRRDAHRVDFTRRDAP